MVAFDAAVLSILLHPGATVGDPGLDGIVERAKERVDALIEDLDEKEERIIVPTPALAELLVVAGDSGPSYLAELTKASRFHICDLNQLAAVELAVWTFEAVEEGDKREGLKTAYQKVKVDRQIVAIAKVNGAQVIYTDDIDVAHLAKRHGIQAVSISELPFPPASQMPLGLEANET